MSNPIKSSDLYKDDGAITAAIQQLELLQSEYDKALKGISKQAIQLGVSIKKVNATTSQQRQVLSDTAKAADQLEKEKKKLTTAYGENAKKLQALKIITSEQNTINKLQAKLADNVAGSYNALSAQYSLNKIALNKLSAEERANNAEAAKLEAQTKDIYEEMKRLQEATGKTSLNVGNYKDSLKGAISETLGLDRVMGILSKNPIVLVLGLIVGTLGALFSAFQKSEKGVQLMTRATGFFNGVMSQLVDVSVKVVDFVTAAFENPQQAIKDLGQLLADQIINRFKAVLELSTTVGRAIGAILTGNLNNLKDVANDAGTALLQLATGLDAQDQKDFANAVKAAADEVERETNAFLKLEIAKRNIANANRSLTKTIENLITKEEILNAIAGDATLSFKEQEDAAAEAAKVIEERAKKQIQLAKNNLSLINQELTLRRNNGEAVDALLDSQLSAYQSVIQAERELTLSVRTNEQERRQLKQDRLERDLDILIDGFDNQKTINERILKDETLTLTQRAKLFQETANLANDSFRKQIETIQEFTGVAVDANSLISESDAVLLNEKIRSLGLSEIIEGRLLEIVRDRKTATLDLIDAEKELLKERNKTFANFTPILTPIQKGDIDGVLKEGQAIIKGFKKDFSDSLRQNEPLTLLETLGINLDDGELQGISTTFNFVKSQLTDLVNLRKQVADEAVNQSNAEVAAAQRTLQAEQDNRAQGFASNSEQAERELNLAKSTQQKALKEQEKARKQQLAIQSIEQVGNLITAASKIYSQVGNPVFAIPLIATMFGTFLAAKVKATSLAKTRFAKGTYEVLGGGSHQSGNDTPLGFQSAGKPAYAEKGEGLAVFAKDKTEKYKSVLPQLIKSINSGTFENQYQSVTDAVKSIPFVVNLGSNTKVDTTTIEKELQAIRKQGERTFYRDEQGRLVEINGNVTKTYV